MRIGFFMMVLFEETILEANIPFMDCTGLFLEQSAKKVYDRPMSKIGRNEPCPCGSGKKYKHCHGKSNIIPINNTSDMFDSNQFQAFPDDVQAWNNSDEAPSFMEYLGESNAATESLNQFKKLMQQNNISSIEEATRFIKEYSAQYSTKPMDEFLGLSPDQIHSVLYNPFDENKNILELRVNLTQDDINTIPIIRQAIYFLEKIYETQPLKATAAGKLPPKLVKDLHEAVYKVYDIANFKVSKEDNYPPISALKHILTFAGLLKKYNKAYSLTKTGNKLVEAKDYDKLYRLLFLNYIEEYNWGFLDGYEELSIIQRAAIFDLYLLKRKAAEFQEDKLLGGIFLNAFPQLLDEVEDSFRSAEERVIRCFVLRFLERFCLSFGLVEKKQQGEDYLSRKYFYKTTALFNRLFLWKI